MISQGFTLSTDLFETQTLSKHFINERCCGEDFANWLHSALTTRGYRISTPIQEDFGWVLLLTREPHVFTLSIGIMDEAIGMVQAEWRIDISFEKPLNGFHAWFRRPPRLELKHLASAIEQCLRTEVRFRNVTAVTP